MSGQIERALARATARTPAIPQPSSSTEEENEISPEQPTPSHSSATPSANIVPTPRRRVHVNLLSDRYTVTKWMIDRAAIEGEKHIISKAVRNFPQFFPGNAKANLQKVSRWWTQRMQTIDLKTEHRHVGQMSSSARNGRLVSFKAIPGRGRKRSVWVRDLYSTLREEFERLRAAGVKFSPSVLRMHALRLIEEAPQDSSFHKTRMYKGKPISSCVSVRWMQHFMTANGIVIRSQTGKLMVSPAKQLFIEKSVAYHLGVVKRAFDSGQLKEGEVDNADETHFIINMDNGKTLGLRGDAHVKYADVVSGGEPMTMMVRISGGANAFIHPPMIIFKNEKRSYPMRGVPDNIPGVCYRTSPKGWMDSATWLKWLSERRAIDSPLPGTSRTLFVDNCSSHILGDEIEHRLETIRTTLRKLPPNATHLVQPADSFVIQKIKDAWRKRWDEFKYECIQRGDWQDSENGNGSGKLKNPGKLFFLRLARDAVRDVNLERDKNGMSYARKAMIITGLAKNGNGVWEEGQLSGELQSIVAKHRNHFEGYPVSPEDVETESEDEV